MDARVMFQNSIKITGDKTLYFDPFRISGAPADADVIFITHDHFDHYSPEDIKKVIKSDTVIVVPKIMEKEAGSRFAGVTAVNPGETLEVCGIPVEAVPAYNVGKAFTRRARASSAIL